MRELLSAIWELILLYFGRDPYEDDKPPEIAEDPVIPPREDEHPLRIGRQIIAFEARRDNDGNLIVYYPPENDGQSKEIAGLGDTYHAEILAILEKTSPPLRENIAAKYIEDYTLEGTGLKLSDPLRVGTLFFVLDTAFNRGPSGCCWIVQTALRALGHSVKRDRKWGPKTRAALFEADRTANNLIAQLRNARERYEREIVGYRANFWKGLTNRWNKAAAIAIRWNKESESSQPAPLPEVLDPDPERIELPKETTADLNAFYGKADPNGKYLDWFQFPTDNIRLYSRNGVNLSDADGDGRDAHRCHKDIVKRLEAALQEIYETLGRFRFEREGWHIYSGCFNYRKKRGGSSLSTHSWGIAIDVNGNENPFKSTETTFSAEAVDIMEKHGFLSGGRAWGKDWMHFQAAIPRISSNSYYALHGLPRNIKRA